MRQNKGKNVPREPDAVLMTVVRVSSGANHSVLRETKPDTKVRGSYRMVLNDARQVCRLQERGNSRLRHRAGWRSKGIRLVNAPP